MIARCLLRVGALATANALSATPRLSPVRMLSTATGSLDVSKYYTQARPDATKDYVMQQAMIRVKDLPSRSNFTATCGFISSCTANFHNGSATSTLSHRLIGL